MENDLILQNFDEGRDGMLPATTDLFGWLREKVTEAEKALRSREQMEESWRTGSEKDWKAAARMSASKTIAKADRFKEAAKHARIAVKCRHELEMAKAAEKALHHCRLFIVDRKGYIADEALERELIKQELEAKFPLPNSLLISKSET
jgi:hypothetical protein